MTVWSLLILVHLCFLPAGIVALCLCRRTVPRSTCSVCSYDLRGTLSYANNCPECGSEIPPPRVPRLRFNRIVVTVGAILVGIPFLLDLVLGLVFLYSIAN